MSALEQLAQAILDGRVYLVPVAMHMVGGGYDSHPAPAYVVTVDPKPEGEPS
jgi:hypothetical protein